MRRRSVNILRRTCWRNGNNFFATSRCRTSASAISRFTRLLSCPCGRWSRHLFIFLFWVFFFPAEISSLLLVRVFRRSGGRRLSLWFCCRFHLKNKLRGHIVMQFDGDLVLASVLDRSLQNNFVSIDLCADFVFQPVHDVLCRYGSKCLAGLASLQCENKPRLADAARQFLSLVQLACFAFSALLFKRIKLTQSRRCNFVRHFARQKIIARITATHLDQVRLGTEPGNILGQDEFS